MSVRPEQNRNVDDEAFPLDFRLVSGVCLSAYYPAVCAALLSQLILYFPWTALLYSAVYLLQHCFWSR